MKSAWPHVAARGHLQSAPQGGPWDDLLALLLVVIRLEVGVDGLASLARVAGPWPVAPCLRAGGAFALLLRVLGCLLVHLHDRRLERLVERFRLGLDVGGCRFRRRQKILEVLQ